MPSAHQGNPIAINRHFEIEIGLLGTSIISDMTETDRDLLHGEIDQYQKYHGKIFLRGTMFALDFMRKHNQAVLTISPIGAASATIDQLSFTEEDGAIVIYAPTRTPQIMLESMVGKTVAEIIGTIPALPLFEKLLVNEVEWHEDYFLLKTKTQWKSYKTNYQRSATW